MKISKIIAHELLDSRGNPTVGTEIQLENGSIGFAISPSGASTGSHEAHEKRDKDANRYYGKGVLDAVNGINTIVRKSVTNKDFSSQNDFDDYLIELDNTVNKKNLGANAIISSSLAFAKAMAHSYNLPLYKYLANGKEISIPTPMMNILNGGAHANNNIDIQEFMIMPTKNCNIKEKVRISSEIYHKLGELLKKHGLECGVGDEGGYAPKLNSDEEAIELILTAIIKSGYSTEDVKLCLDIAASEWFNNGKYVKPKSGESFDAESLIKYYTKLISNYPIISIEDPLSEDDWDNFNILTNELGDKIQIVGDDLFVTNEIRLNKGIENNVANAILLKPNQIGTLSETIKVIDRAKKANYATIISHRSGESEDTSIADIGVGFDLKQIKTGAPCRGERTSKYNRVIMIENEL